MRTLAALIVFSSLMLSACNDKIAPGLSASKLKCSGLENPEGVGMTPTFSWDLTSDKRGQKQTAWQIIIGSDKSVTDKFIGDIWDSGKQTSEKSDWISFHGHPLLPGEKYFWRVRVWDKNGEPSLWSETGEFITGLFKKEDWGSAKWIGYEEIPDSLLLVPGVHGNGDNLGEKAKKRVTVPYFRKVFSVSKKITSAYLFISGLGQYELYINGNKIGDRFLAPGWTDYRSKCFYNTYNITSEITKGKNAVGVIVGNGFYNINRERYRKLVIAYGAPKLILKLEVRYNDGSKEIVTSDETWKVSPSPITFSSIYGGEDYDAGLEQDGWNDAGFNDEKWRNALTVKEPSGMLEPEMDYPVKVSEVIDYKKISEPAKNTFIYDFGQNASGIIKIKLKGKKGEEVRFTPGELIGDDSLVYQDATGRPYYFSYTIKGESEETWIPRFTYYGFRYIQVNGAVPAGIPDHENIPVLNEIKLLHTRNSSPEAGTFKCSSELFNSVYELIKWSIKSNLASVATDCPHREKLGWLEQTHLMGNSIKFIYDIHNLYDKVIDDMMEAQLENGLVPDIAPEYVPFEAGFRDSPEWGSACIILPYDMYQWYGDIEAVKKGYPMMKKYVAYLQKMSDKNILSHGLGDWYDLGPKFPGEAQLTPKALTATSIYYYDVKLLGEMAELIGEKEDVTVYKTLSEEIRKSFNDKFLDNKTNVYSTGSQTAYSMPLFFGMVDDAKKPQVVANLIKSIKDNKNALTAGDIGYRYLLRVLEEENQSQLIYEMNSRNDVPGYGYQLSKGATSLTESWAALKYVSNNHMMLGHIMEWFYSGIGGIRQIPGSSGYDEIIISPEIVGDLTWAETTYRSVRGEIMSEWNLDGDNLVLRVKVPVGCKAIIAVPQSEPEKIFESGKLISESKDIKVKETNSGKTFCEVSSGEYIFKTTFKNN
jgi:hypothetical protein